MSERMKRVTLINTTLAAAIALPALLICGCSVDVYSPQPAVVVEAAPPDQEVVVEPPPPVVYEEPAPAPEVGMVWIQPEYVVVGGRYELRHGRWDRPPAGHGRWVASHYEHGEHGYVYVAGRWN
jgi:hypothetical protein